MVNQEESLPNENHEQEVILACHAPMKVICERDNDPIAISKKLASTVKGFSPRTVERIKNHPWTEDTALVFVNGVEDEQWNETNTNDFMALCSVVDRPAHAAEWHLHSYRLYSNLCPPNNDGEYPEERLSQIAALFAVTEAMLFESDQDPYMYEENSSKNLLYIFNPELQSLVLHPAPYKREDVVNAIIATSTFDADRIKMIIDSDASSLGSGIL